MRPDHLKQIDTLLGEARSLPHGPARLALLEEAVHLADAHQDLDQGFRLRESLVETATFGGFPEKLLVAFSWRLAQCDRYPERFNERDLLWQYKWAMGQARQFSQVSRGQIEGMLEDMTRRYRRQGYGLRPVYKLRHVLARTMGDVDQARHWRRKWQAAAVGIGNDCTACELDDEMGYLLHRGRGEAAVEKARPILEGRLRCTRVPHVTYPRLLVPLFDLGRRAEADDYQARGQRLLSNDPDWVWEAALHVDYLTRTAKLARATRLFERHLPWAQETRAQGEAFDFFLAGVRLFEKLAEEGKKTVALRLPSPLKPEGVDGKPSVPGLRDLFLEKCRDLADRFDRRNGTDRYARRLETRQVNSDWKP